MQFVYVLNGLVINRVEYGDQTPPLKDGEADVVPSLTNAEAPGDNFDIQPALKDRRLAAIDPLLLKELLSLTNDLRARKLIPDPPLTDKDYQDSLKAKM